MKIGFYGNVNCFPFRYALELKNQGYEVLFIIDKNQKHKLHRPEYRFSEISYPYPNWIKEFIISKPDLKIAFPNIFFKEPIKLLNSCNIVFLNDFTHGIKPFLNENILSVSMCSGGDLDFYARLDLLEQRVVIRKKILKLFTPLKKVLLKKSILNIREGIKQSYILHYYFKDIIPSMEKLIDDIKGDNEYIRSKNLGVNSEDVPFCPFVKKDKLMIFNPTRFVWKEPLAEGIQPWSNKRNDIMIKGIGLFYKKHQVELDIHFVEKGPDVKESKQLCDEVGISHMITWHKEMTQKDIFDFYRECDISFDQLGNHFVAYGGLDVMLTGRPVIANGRPEVLEKVFGKPLPLCQATNEEDVAMWIGRLSFEDGLKEKIGKESREFVLEYYSMKKTVETYMRHLKKKLKK